MSAASVKEEVIRLLDDLPEERIAEVLDFTLFVKTRNRTSQLQREQLIRHVPAENLNALKGIVSWGGDAVEDAERLYDGRD